MLYITGDTHGDPRKLANTVFHGTEDDTIIICGDFGFIWRGDQRDDYWLNWLSKKPFLTLFVDGNHENFPALYKYPVTTWNGGKVHMIRHNVLHLMRGEIFTMKDRKFFVMGGGTSHDKEYRQEFISWWREEEPNCREITNGMDNLDKVDWKVDFVLAHEIPQAVISKIAPTWDEDCGVRKTLDLFNERLQFEIWYSGHYHEDVLLDDKYQILYNTIIPVGAVLLDEE